MLSLIWWVKFNFFSLICFATLFAFAWKICAGNVYDWRSATRIQFILSEVVIVFPCLRFQLISKSGKITIVPFRIADHNSLDAKYVAHKMYHKIYLYLGSPAILTYAHFTIVNRFFKIDSHTVSNQNCGQKFKLFFCSSWSSTSFSRFAFHIPFATFFDVNQIILERLIWASLTCRTIYVCWASVLLLFW